MTGWMGHRYRPWVHYCKCWARSQQGLGVPVWLDRGLLTRPVHALAASSPEIVEMVFSLSGAPVNRLGPITLSMGGIAFDTQVTGGSDHNTGTAGICKGDLVKVVHPSASLCAILGDILGTFGSSDLVDVGLPISWNRMFNSFALKYLGRTHLHSASKFFMGSFRWVLHFAFG